MKSIIARLFFLILKGSVDIKVMYVGFHHGGLIDVNAYHLMISTTELINTSTISHSYCLSACGVRTFKICLFITFQVSSAVLLTIDTVLSTSGPQKLFSD
jgi:hypothetical protein